MRLPDIPEQSWLLDQAAQFEAKTKGLLDAAIFHSASRDMEAEAIPPDFPYTGGEDTLSEQERLNQEMLQRQEQERQAQLYRDQQRQAEEAVQQQEQERLTAASQAATDAGIPHPDSVYDDFMKSSIRPTSSPDNDGSGVLNNPLASHLVDNAAAMTLIPDDPSKVSTASDFDSFVNNLWSGAQNIGQKLSDNWTPQNPDLGLASPEIGTNNYGPPGPLRMADSGLVNDLSRSTIGPNIADTANKIKTAASDLVSEYKAQPTPTEEELHLGMPIGRDLLPEEQAAMASSGEAIKSASALPMKVIGAVADLVLGDPEQKLRYTDPYGIMDTLGVTEGMTRGEIATQLAPAAIMEIPQLMQIGEQMVDSPVATGSMLTGFAIAGRLAPLLKTPIGQRTALAVLGGIVGGADAYINQRDLGVKDEALLGSAGAVAARRVIPPAIRLFKDVLSSPRAIDAYRYLDQLAAKVGSDVIDQVTTKYPALADSISSEASNALATGSPRGWDSISGMGEGERRSREMASVRAPYGAAIGATAGAVEGFNTGQEGDSLLDRAARVGTGALLGAPVGRFAAREGTVAAGKFLDSLISRGAISADVLETHPPTADRIRALFALGAKDLADNEPVELPGMASYLARSNPEVRQEIPAFFKPGITAGEIRSLTVDPGIISRVYNASTELVADAITGIRNRRQRLSELGADRVTIDGIPEYWRLSASRAIHNPQTAPETGWSPMGAAHRVDDPEMTGFVANVAQTLGMPTPALYITDTPEINAAAMRVGQGQNRKYVMMITKGMLDAGFTKDEISALMMHEMAHMAERSTGYVLPPAVVDKLTSIPVAKLEPRIIRAIEAKGGTYDPETGVTQGVTRAQSRRGAGGVATRGGPFYEPVDERTTSSYYSTGEGSKLGGNVLVPRTITRYRNPFIMERSNPTDGAYGAYDDAFRKLGITSEDGSPLTRQDVHDELRSIQDSWDQTTDPRRVQAIKDLVSKYGGDPSTVDEQLRLRPGQSESEYSIVENIIGNNARKRGHDAAFLMEPGEVDFEAVRNHPDYKQAREVANRTYQERQDYEREFVRNHPTGGYEEGYDAPAYTKDPEWETLNDKYIQASHLFDQISNELHNDPQYNVPDFTEIMSAREDRNPVPAPQRVDSEAQIQELQGQMNSAYTEFQRANNLHLDWQDQIVHYAGDPPPQIVEHYETSYAEKELAWSKYQQLSDQVRKLQEANTPHDIANYEGRAGYSIHPDIAVPEGVARRTFDVPEPIHKPVTQDMIDAAKAEHAAATKALDDLGYVGYGQPGRDQYDVAFERAREATSQLSRLQGGIHPDTVTEGDILHQRDIADNLRIRAQQLRDQAHSMTEDSGYSDIEWGKAYDAANAATARSEEAYDKLSELRDRKAEQDKGTPPPEWKPFEGSDVGPRRWGITGPDEKVVQYAASEAEAKDLTDALIGRTGKHYDYELLPAEHELQHGPPTGTTEPSLNVIGYTPGESHKGKWEIFDSKSGETIAVVGTEKDASDVANQFTKGDVDYEQIAQNAWKPTLSSGNLAGGFAGGVAGATSEDDDQDKPLSTLGGVVLGTIFGPKYINPIFEKNPKLLQTPGLKMYQRAASEAKLTNPGFFENAYQYWAPKLTDSYARLAQYQNDIAHEFLKQTGELIPASALAAELKRLDAGRAAEMMVNRNIKPALKTFQDIGIPEDKIDELLQSYQNVDVAKHFGNYANTGLLADRDFPGGVTASDSMKTIYDFESDLRTANPENYKSYMDAMRQVWDHGRQLLDIKREAGLITDDTYRTLRSVYPHYVPTRITDHLADDGFVQAGRSLSVTSNTLKALTEQGTTKDALSPVAALVSDTYKTHAYANKNRVFNALMGMWMEAMKLDPYMQVETSSQRRVNELSNLIRVRSAKIDTHDANWVPVEGFVDGVKVKLAVHKDLGDVTKFEAPVNIPIISGIMQAFRAGATSRNPVFLTANGALDFINYAQRETARNNGNPIPALWNYARALTETVLDPRVWGDIASNEYRGGAQQLLSQGGGLSGHSNVSGRIGQSWITRADRQIQNARRAEQNLPPVSDSMADRFGDGLRKILHQSGWTPESEASSEVRRLRQSSPLPTGAGALAVGGAAGANEYANQDPNAPVTERLARTLGATAAGAVGGAVLSNVRVTPRGMHLAEKPADIARILKDLVTLKPVEAIGERIELTPRVAAMRNAEWRYKRPIADLQNERDAVAKFISPSNVQAGQPITMLPKQYANANGMPARSLKEIDAALDDAYLRRRVESTNAARTTTLDFAKGGTGAKIVNQFIPFFNVGLQSVVDIPRAIQENPKAYIGTALASALGPLYVAEVLNNIDDQTAKDYADVPNEIKDQGLVAMLPEKYFGPAPVDENGNRHPQFIHIRYRQLAPLAVLSREIFQKGLGIDSRRPLDERRAMVDAAIGAISQWSPVSVNNSADLTMGLIPPGLSTTMQLTVNKDTYRGRDIVTKAADERASPLSQLLAQHLGFSENSKRPSWWEFATTDALSGYAQMWHGASKSLYPGEESRMPQNIPIAGGLIGRVQKGTIGQRVEDARNNVITPEAQALLEQQGIDLRPTPADSVISGIPLTQEEYAKYQNIVNRETDDAIKTFARIPKFQSMPALLKKQQLQAEIDTRRELAQAIIMKDIPQAERRRRYDREAAKGHVLPIPPRK